MKKLQDYTIAIIFSAICCGIAAIMGLIEVHDNHQTAGGDKRRPLGPTAILVYTAEWIRKITHKVITTFHPSTHDRVRQLSQDEMIREIYSEATHISLDDLDDSEETCDPIIITE